MFKVVTNFVPSGDQPGAIRALAQGVRAGSPHQVLLGVTGSGKTFSMAHVIAEVQMPTLVLAPNKTLAAQLYNELRGLFPENAVEYFVSYYDYYQPEAFIPSTNTYIEKDAQINDEIDKLRHSATRSLLARKDVIVVASVSCIYGLGSPEEYLNQMLHLKVGEKIGRDPVIRHLVDIQYQRNDDDFSRGTFRVRGDVVELVPSYEEELAIRIEFFGDEIEKIYGVHPLTGKSLYQMPEVFIYPATHYLTDPYKMKHAVSEIRKELQERIAFFRSQDKLVEAQRIEQRTLFDLEMMEEMGFCKGIENYSRHLTGKNPGDPPPTLIEFFPKPFLVLIDESHVSLPQLRGMYRGDRQRKQTLVEFGFRLPSALDNRPLRYDEFAQLTSQCIYVSATPSDEELQMAQGQVVEQVIRPTGLLDPVVEVRSAKNQVDDLLHEVRLRIAQGDRILATTLTKRMAEDLTEYYAEVGIKVRYLHSDIETFERMEILSALRRGEFDLLVGINLLREGLDLPEVSLVAILDADKEGFLRSRRSLIQTMGRAARNVNGKVILYGDVMTDSMRAAIQETDRRRQKQQAYNAAHGITPQSVKRQMNDVLKTIYERDYIPVPLLEEESSVYKTREDVEKSIRNLDLKMKAASKALRFEEAIQFREELRTLQKMALELFGKD